MDWSHLAYELSSHVIEGKIEERVEDEEDDEQDASSCQMTLRKERILAIEKGSTIWHSV
jgi:hypothetical protein